MCRARSPGRSPDQAAHEGDDDARAKCQPAHCQQRALAAPERLGQRAEQELKALSRVKTVRHPYILSLERYDIIDGQLLIVMELADKNLWDRYKECRLQGLQGIPREESVAL